MCVCVCECVCVCVCVCVYVCCIGHKMCLSPWQPVLLDNCSLFHPQTVIEQGGVAPGGLNFDCKVRRESTALQDMFIGHIGNYCYNYRDSPSMIVITSVLCSLRCHGYHGPWSAQCSPDTSRWSHSKTTEGIYTGYGTYSEPSLM